MKYTLVDLCCVALGHEPSAAVVGAKRRQQSRQTGGGRPRRRRCAARTEWAHGQGRRQVLGAGTVARRRRRAARARQPDLRDDWDLAKGMARTTGTATSKYPAPETELHRDRLADARLRHRRAGQQPMSGIRVATHLRELERASPPLLLKAMDDPGDSALRTPAARRSIAAGGLLDGGRHKFIMLFDP